MQRLKFFANGEWHESKSKEYFEVKNPSTGELLALTPKCSYEEMDFAIKSAKEAFPVWSGTPLQKRLQVLFNFRDLVDQHLDELVMILCKENGKVFSESMGDVLKVKEVVEHACGLPTLLMGESLMDVSSGYDTVLYRESVGVFAGIVPFNFPAMIPMGWMMPLCIGTGNTMVLKASKATPMTALRLTELLHLAGLPKGVFNIITCDTKVSTYMIEHKDIKGVSFVGSTDVGKSIYAKASAAGKRVQTMCGAKNHALVLEDAPLQRTARGIINASFGCAGERCMSLPVIVVQESVADKLVALLRQYASEIKLGKAWEKDTQMGPVISAAHKEKITGWISKGIGEGAELVLDGRNVIVKGCEGGFFIGPTIFDKVTPEMTIGDEEIFGPVLCIKRVKDFEEGIALMNSNRFANGSAIFTQNGHYSRQFAKRTHAGMVGINVGIPVPTAFFPFTGHKDSFFGDLHIMGKDGVRFFTETKAVTTCWFDEEEMIREKIDTWDGTM